jgi:alpha-tubulin suppressor-like RCC1 family protein
LWSWGNNNYGQLGLNDVAKRSSPVQIGALTSWYQVAAGSNFTLAIKTDGTMWSWGTDSFGALGLNTSGVHKSSPVQIGALTTWSQIASGTSFSLAIKTDGTMWSWGRSNNGQLGLGEGGAYAARSSPVQIGALTTWSKVVAGGEQSLAIKTDGTLWSWGSNSTGELGLNDAANRSSPVQIGALTTWSQIAGGNNHTLAIKTDKTLWSWGYNYAGKLGLNDVVARSSPVQVGVLATWLSLPKMPASNSSLAIKG